MITRFLKNERGNIFTMLIGGIALAGTMSYILYQTISGPMATMSRVTKQTAAQQGIQSMSMASIVAAVNQTADGDCDADGFIEPTVYRDSGGTLPQPTGGGLLPTTLADSVLDPWGTDYGYCVWDVGATNNPAVDNGCGAGVNRLLGSPTPLAGDGVTQTVFAVISAGPDRAFQASCAAYTNATTDVITGGGDDIVQRFSYMEADIMASRLWQVDPDTGDADTVEIDKDLTVPLADIKALSLVTDTGGDVTAAAGIQLGDQNQVTTCTAGNEGLIRYNDGSGSAITIESTTPVTRVADGTNTSATADFPTGDMPSASATVIVAISGQATGGAFSVTSVTDNHGNTYNAYPAGGAATAGGSNQDVYLYASDITTTGTPFTVTANVTGGTSRQFSFGAMSVTGLAAGPTTTTGMVIDGTGQADNAAPIGASTTVTTGTTPDQANVFAVGVLGYADAGANDINVRYQPEDGWKQILVNHDAQVYTGLSVVARVVADTTETVDHTWAHDTNAANAYTAGLLTVFDGATTTTGTASLDFCDEDAGDDTWVSFAESGGAGGTGLNDLSDAFADYTDDNLIIGDPDEPPAVTSAAAPTITAVQETNDLIAGAAATSGQVTFGAGLTPGNLVVVGIAGVEAGAPGYDIVSVTDDGGNEYIQAVQSDYSNTRNNRAMIFYAHVDNAATVITATNVRSSKLRMTAVEFSGLDPAAPLDAVGQTAPATSSFVTSALTETDITSEIEMIFGVMVGGSSVSNVGMIFDDDTGTFDSVGMYWTPTFGLGAKSAPFTHSNTDDRAAVIATFRRALPDGTGNLSVGENAGAANVTGSGNIAVGFGASDASTDSVGNIMIGADAAGVTTGAGNGNTGLGVQALENITGRHNIGIGHQAGQALTADDQNIAIGYQTLSANAGMDRNIALGYQAMQNNIGDENIGIGYQALQDNTANENVAVGYQALLENTTGSNNVAVGYQALDANTTGSNNIAFGYNACGALTTTSTDQNTCFGSGAMSGAATNGLVAFGYNALAAVTDLGNNLELGHTAFGYNALAANGATVLTFYNTAVGARALQSNTTGNSNTAVGYQALRDNTIGDSNTAIGASALAINISGARNTAVGYWAMALNQDGVDNTALGFESMMNNVSGNFNAAVGYQAGRGITSNNNTALGHEALYTGGAGNNTVFGAFAGRSMGAGETDNVAVGYDALRNASTATQLVAVGSGAASQGTGGTETVAVGYQALYSVTTGAARNTAFGTEALKDLTTGDDNTAVGYRALEDIVDQNDNTAIGTSALASADSSDNTAVGYQAGMNVNSGYENVAIGYQAMQTTGSGGIFDRHNVAVGYQASYNLGRTATVIGSQALGDGTASAFDYMVAIGYRAAYDSEARNTAIGSEALDNTTTGGENTAIGYKALEGNIWGVGNTAIGANAGPSTSFITVSGAVDNGSGEIRLTVSDSTVLNCALAPVSPVCTGTTDLLIHVNNVGGVPNATGEWRAKVISAGTPGTIDLVGSTWAGSYTSGGEVYFWLLDNTTAIGANATVYTENTVRFGDGSVTVIQGQDAAWTTVSDKRLKKDIKESDLGLDFVKDLKPVSYYKKKGNGLLDYGFIAQEVQEALGPRKTNMIWEDKDPARTLHFRSDDMIAPLVKAVQERQQKINNQQEKIDDLRALVEHLESSLPDSSDMPALQ